MTCRYCAIKSKIDSIKVTTLRKFYAYLISFNCLGLTYLGLASSSTCLSQPTTVAKQSQAQKELIKKLTEQAAKAQKAKDYALAEKYYRQALDKGDLKSATRLGALLEEGMTGPSDFQAAEKYYRMAAPGDPEAACRLSGLIGYNSRNQVRSSHNGREIPEEALYWLKSSADRGYLEAQCRMGTVYSNDKKDRERMAIALKYRLMAAAQGDSRNAYRAGNYLLSGIAGRKDPVKAEELLKMAARTNPNACKLLANLYANGEQGIKADPAKAKEWRDKGIALSKQINATDAEIIKSFNRE